MGGGDRADGLRTVDGGLEKETDRCCNTHRTDLSGSSYEGIRTLYSQVRGKLAKKTAQTVPRTHRVLCPSPQDPLRSVLKRIAAPVCFLLQSPVLCPQPVRPVASAHPASLLYFQVTDLGDSLIIVRFKSTHSHLKRIHRLSEHITHVFTNVGEKPGRGDGMAWAAGVWAFFGTGAKSAAGKRLREDLSRSCGEGHKTLWVRGTV